MSFWGWLFILGLLSVLGGLAWHVYQHPEELERLAGRARKVKQAVEEEPVEAEEPIERVGFLARELTAAERFASLPLNTLITVSPKSGSTCDLQVVGKYSFHQRVEKPRGSKNWVRSGAVWHAMVCEGDPGFYDGPILILLPDPRDPARCYVLDDVEILLPTQAKSFEDEGQAFGKEEIPGSVSVEWYGESYKIQSIGVYDAEGVGIPHEPVGLLVRFMLAENGDAAIWIEDAKKGEGAIDRAWTGRRLNLNDWVKKIYTPEG